MALKKKMNIYKREQGGIKEGREKKMREGDRVREEKQKLERRESQNRYVTSSLCLRKKYC